MRARSSSIYTKRPEIPIAQPIGRNSLPETLPDFPEIDLSPPTLKKANSANEIPSLFEDFGPVIEKKFKEDFTGDFVKNIRSSIDETKYNRCSIDEFMSASTVSTNSSSSIGSNHTSFSCKICPVTFSTVIFDDYFGGKTMEKAQKMFKGMIIGVQGAGKRSLLQALFPDNKNAVPIAKQQFDLVTKTVEKSDIINRFHFWLKEPNLKDKRLNPLINMYYKSCSVFFFVYNPDIKSSFDELENEIQLVYQANPKKQLVLFLIANKRGNKTNFKVTSTDVNALKDKYDIKFFLEVDASKGAPGDLRSFTEYFLK